MSKVILTIKIVSVEYDYGLEMKGWKRDIA